MSANSRKGDQMRWDIAKWHHILPTFTVQFSPNICREALELQLESCFKEVAHPMIRQNPEFLTTFKPPKILLVSFAASRTCEAFQPKMFLFGLTSVEFCQLCSNALPCLWFELAQQSERQVCSTFVHIIQVRRYACQPNLKRVYQVLSNCQDMKLL